MMRLYVDDRLCDLAADVAIPVGFDAADMSDVAAGRSGLSLTVKLPSTPANDAVFGRALDPYAAERFNAAHHAARIEAGTAVLFSGTAYLLSGIVRNAVGRGCLRGAHHGRCGAVGGTCGADDDRRQQHRVLHAAYAR